MTHNENMLITIAKVLYRAKKVSICSFCKITMSIGDYKNIHLKVCEIEILLANSFS